METKKENEIVEIFAGYSTEAEFVKCLLTDSGVDAYLKDEYIGTLAPWWAAQGGAGAVKVVISNQDYTRAKVIVDEYFKNLKSEK